MSFITKLLQSLGLRSQPRPQPTAEQYQAYHLSQWPRAGAGFLLVDGQHPKFQASVHISTESLLQWADSYSHRIMIGNNEQQGALWALPYWLAAADASLGTTPLPKPLDSVLMSEIETLVKSYQAQVTCALCGDTQLTITESDKINSFHYFTWREQWLCGNGHELHHRDHELHLNLAFKAKTQSDPQTDS